MTDQPTDALSNALGSILPADQARLVAARLQAIVGEYANLRDAIAAKLEDERTRRAAVRAIRTAYVRFYELMTSSDAETQAASIPSAVYAPALLHIYRHCTGLLSTDDVELELDVNTGFPTSTGNEPRATVAPQNRRGPKPALLRLAIVTETVFALRAAGVPVKLTRAGTSERVVKEVLKHCGESMGDVIDLMQKAIEDLDHDSMRGPNPASIDADSLS